VKLLTTGASGASDEYALLLTDQIRVWGRRSDAAQIEAERKEYAPSMKKSTTAKLIGYALMLSRESWHCYCGVCLVCTVSHADVDVWVMVCGVRLLVRYCPPLRCVKKAFLFIVLFMLSVVDRRSCCVVQVMPHTKRKYIRS
jgi:hypothetical protein